MARSRPADPPARTLQAVHRGDLIDETLRDDGSLEVTGLGDIGERLAGALPSSGGSTPPTRFPLDEALVALSPGLVWPGSEGDLDGRPPNPDSCYILGFEVVLNGLIIIPGDVNTDGSIPLTPAGGLREDLAPLVQQINVIEMYPNTPNTARWILNANGSSNVTMHTGQGTVADTYIFIDNVRWLLASAVA